LVVLHCFLGAVRLLNLGLSGSLGYQIEFIAVFSLLNNNIVLFVRLFLDGIS
jgi:hypothetical protein